MGFSCSAQGARGQSCSVLILDEFSFVPQNIADSLFAAVYPVVSASKNGKVIIVSTPNGKHNLYYDLWKKANTKNDPDNADGWKPFIMYWWQVPGRDEQSFPLVYALCLEFRELYPVLVSRLVGDEPYCGHIV